MSDSNTSANIGSFLSAMAQDHHALSVEGSAHATGPIPFLTISRQTGAGGHSLAKALTKAMKAETGNPLFQNWQMFDEELCELIIKDQTLWVSMESLLSEEYHSKLEDFFAGVMFGNTAQDVVVGKIFRSIHKLASVGKAIIVGRGGACVTRELPGGVHVRLVAGHASRVAHMVKRMNLSEQEAEAMVVRQDHNRAKLVHTHFAEDIDNPLLYDAVCNTDRMSVNQIAPLLITLISDKAKKLEQIREAA
jgi:cytidylate kinase